MDPTAQAWFERRSSHARDWPLSRLLDTKGGTTVSVVLPALNEEATVGRIVERIRRDLIDRHHSVQFVKATYDRALQTPDAFVPAGGGRVTELVARPLLALHWPALSGFVQPLGGEYAARRSLLEGLPFPCGYGVEFGLLVDTYRTVGLAAMAQVDLSRRKHRNSDLHKLGQMATEILQVAERRLGRREDEQVLLTQFARDGSGYRVIDNDMTELERPPIITLDAYRSRPR